MNRVNVFAIHRCINEGYGLIQIFTEKIRISPTKLWRVCDGDDGDDDNDENDDDNHGQWVLVGGVVLVSYCWQWL